MQPMERTIDDVVRIEKAKLTPRGLVASSTTTLADVCKDYFLFTHAALLIYGNLPFDPLTQFCITQNNGQPPGVIMFDQPVFQGLEINGDAMFNSILFGLPLDKKDEFLFELGIIGIKEPVTKTYLNTVVQQLPMVDYLALKKKPSGPLSYITIYAVGLDGNKACLHFKPAKIPPRDCIGLVIDNPRPEMVQFAKTIFEGQP